LVGSAPDEDCEELPGARRIEATGQVVTTRRNGLATLPEEALVKRAGIIVVLTAALALLAGCTAQPSTPNVNHPTSGSVLTVSDRRDGQTVVLQTGEQLRVVLASTYWSFQPPTDATVLSPHDATRVIPEMSHCVPGGGCGTVVQMYDALTFGSSVVTATRSSCGESMGCTSSSGKFQVTVIVR
jgi:hypothetical protein